MSPEMSDSFELASTSSVSLRDRAGHEGRPGHRVALLEHEDQEGLGVEEQVVDVPDHEEAEERRAARRCR